MQELEHRIMILALKKKKNQGDLGKKIMKRIQHLLTTRFLKL